MAGKEPKEVSLKSGNQVQLWTIIIVNLALFFLTVKTNNLTAIGVRSLVQEWETMLPAGLGLIFCSIAIEQLSPNTKARLVFWRWNNPLPGSEAFTRHARNDPRIDLSALEKQFSPLPESPNEQNQLWYKIYRSVSDEASVIDVHKKFLLTRDYTALSFMMIFLLGISGLIYISSFKTSVLYLLILILQYLFVRQAAKNNGTRFVTTVLAVKSTSI